MYNIGFEDFEAAVGRLRNPPLPFMLLRFSPNKTRSFVIKVSLFSCRKVKKEAEESSRAGVNRGK